MQLDAFREAVGRAARATTIASGENGAPYERDAMQYSGRAACVLLPAHRDDVVEIARLAHEHRVKLIAQGARTGLVGAAVPDGTGMQCVLSLERLDKVIAFDAGNRSITVEAGLRMSSLDRLLADRGLMFPIDIGCDPSVGGLVATNAGGSRLMKYGDVRRHVLGLEVVLADRYGTRIDALAPLRKNNTGFDVKQCFIGAGGALGIVTAVSLELARRERSSAAFFVAFDSFEGAHATVAAIEDAFGDLLAAFEVIASDTLAATLSAFPVLRAPLPVDAGRSFALIEVATAMAGLDTVFAERGATVLEELSRRGLVANAALDTSLETISLFWRIRDSVPLALATLGTPISFDVAFSRTDVAPFLAAVAEWLRHSHPLVAAHVFGHFGDGGVHLVVLVPHDARDLYTPAKVALMRTGVYRIVEAHRGSFSAEHGVGPANFAFYRTATREPQRRVAAQLQRIFDPERVLGRCGYDAAESGAPERSLHTDP
ncbi:FAD-binding oxidoreductase [Trinickia symbiotica]|uniref:FAD-binding oxidoreductase n=1 Tax=Trinickia symbiotica TaxID=863227 RepID=UPI00035D43A8|nr:FAD-binding oxidoreductase [Trinickia symbiotica]